MGQNMGQIVRQQNFQRSPNLISICVDEIRNGELSGRLYHCYSEEACPFSNVAHLIELAENLFDQIKFPQASTQMRTSGLIKGCASFCVQKGEIGQSSGCKKDR